MPEATDKKQFLGLKGVKTILEGLKGEYSPLGHKHTTSEIDGYIEPAQADWEQSDETQLNYILNRTHYRVVNSEAIKETFTVGTIELMHDLSEYTGSLNILKVENIAKSHDVTNRHFELVITLNSGSAMISDNSYIANYAEMLDSTNYKYQYLNNVYLYFILDLSTLPDEYVDTFTSLGIYIECIDGSENYISMIEKITSSIVAYQTLDSKYIGTDIARKTYVDDIIATIPGQVQSSWNQNDSTAKDYIIGRTHYETMENEVDFYLENTDISYQGSAILLDISDEVQSLFEDNAIIYLGWNHQCYECFVKSFKWGSSFTTYYIGNRSLPSFHTGEDTGESFCISICKNTLPNKLEIISSNNGKFVLSISKSKFGIITLDEKFIPDTIERTSNRTHYKYENSKKLLTTINSVANNIDEKISFILNGSAVQYFVDGKDYTIEVGLEKDTGTAIKNENNGHFTIITETFTLEFSHSYGGYMLSLNNANSSFTTGESYDVKISRASYYTYVPLDERYIPDTIARTSNYLAKDNTDDFTPTDDYNPSTKKYVDDTKIATLEEITNLKYNQISMVDDKNGCDYIVRMRGGKLISYCAASSISVATLPTKTEYSVGETFDATGMVVTATCQDSTEREVAGYVYSDAALTVDDTTVEISYTENGQTFTTTVTITVTEAISTEENTETIE